MVSTFQELGGGAGGEGATGGDSERKVPEVPLRRAGAAPSAPPAPVRAPLGCLPLAHCPPARASLTLWQSWGDYVDPGI